MDQPSGSPRIVRLIAPVREQVVEAIRQQIFAGELAPGQRLIERELTEHLGVSRNTLREAYRQLEAEGFIVITPHKGPVISRLDDREARAVYELREAIECFAIQLFVERASADQVQDLGQRVAESRRAEVSLSPSDAPSLIGAVCIPSVNRPREGAPNDLVQELPGASDRAVRFLPGRVGEAAAADPGRAGGEQRPVRGHGRLPCLRGLVLSLDVVLSRAQPQTRGCGPTGSVRTATVRTS